MCEGPAVTQDSLDLTLSAPRPPAPHALTNNNSPRPRHSHAIVSSAVGPEYYVGITSFVDKTQLEPGCSVLLNNKVLARLCGHRSSPELCLPQASLTLAATHTHTHTHLTAAAATAATLYSHTPVTPQVMSVVGILQDETDPMVSVMKVRRCVM